MSIYSRPFSNDLARSTLPAVPGVVLSIETDSLAVIVYLRTLSYLAGGRGMLELDIMADFATAATAALENPLFESSAAVSYSAGTTKREKRNVKKTSVSKYELISEAAPNSLNANKIRKRPKSLKIRGKNGLYTHDYLAPQKRPRGRPPLAQKIPAIFALSNSNHNSHLQTVSYNIKNEYGYGNSLSNASLLNRSPRGEHTHIGTSNSNSSRNNADCGANDSSRANKPNASAVTQRLLSRLMTEEPMDTTELHRGMSDIPRDIVQACLDVLLVLGLVIKIVDNTDATSVLYTIVNHVKVPEAIDIRNVKNEIANKGQSISYLEERIANLIALTNRSDMSPKERKAELIRMSNGNDLRYFH